jgi:hypothetical protein
MVGILEGASTVEDTDIPNLARLPQDHRIVLKLMPKSCESSWPGERQGREMTRLTFEIFTIDVNPLKDIF